MTKKIIYDQHNREEQCYCCLGSADKEIVQEKIDEKPFKPGDSVYPMTSTRTRISTEERNRTLKKEDTPADL